VQVLIVDVACHRGRDNELVIKELALVGDTDGVTTHQTFVFKPPYPYHTLSPSQRYTAYWTTYKLHGLTWGEGLIPYDKLYSILSGATADYPIIFTKGSEKASELSKIIGVTVEDLDSHGCPKAENITLPRLVVCGMGHVDNCALTKSLKYLQWVRSSNVFV
jgi:hypothetical protein